MRIKQNLTLGGVIMLVVMAGIIASGYFWYSHARSVRIREERAAKVAAAEAKIVVHEDDIKKLEADKKTLDADMDALKPKIKAAQATVDASSDKAKEMNGHLADFRRKMDDARRTAEQRNRETMQQTANRNRSGNPDAAKIRAAENNLAALQKELEKANCHYDCMGRSKKTDKVRPSDDGVWTSDKNSSYVYWKCKKHGYRFTSSIDYLDHKNEVSQLTAKIGQAQRAIAELRNQATAETVQQTTNTVRFDAAAWNAAYTEHQETVRKAQEAANEDRKALDKLNEEKRELDSKLSDIERKIENNNAAIKSERLLIADNQK